LDRRQEQGDQDTDDGDNHQQFDEGKTSFARESNHDMSPQKNDGNKAPTTATTAEDHTPISE
jgi:hypothetical protein